MDPYPFFADLGAELAQDRDVNNGCKTYATAHPVYMVQQRVRIYGIHPRLTDPDGSEKTEDGEEIYYVERWEFVQGAVSLTRRGIERYLRLNGHNLEKPRIYVASAARCHETIDLMKALEAVAENMAL